MKKVGALWLCMEASLCVIEDLPVGVKYPGLQCVHFLELPCMFKQAMC